MKGLIKKQKGFTLVEVLVALVILGVLASALLLGVSTALKSSATSDELATAESLARSQMEYIKNEPYAGSYTVPVPAEYNSAGYSTTIAVQPVTGKVGLQQITISVDHHGNIVFTLEGYKSNR